MGLIRIHDVSLRFGDTALLDRVALQIEAGEKIGLLGRNGSGKSTMMKLLAGKISADSGTIERNGVSVAMLPQDVPDDLPGAVYDIVAMGGMEHARLLREYHELAGRIAREHDAGLIRALENVQHKIEASGAWHYHHRIKTVIERMSLDEDVLFRTLSAGMKRRVFLAKALLNEPDLLLLDEPTNHLDMRTRDIFQQALTEYHGTIIIVSHDRYFLDKLVSRVIEIREGKILEYPGNYSYFIQKRAERLETEKLSLTEESSRENATPSKNDEKERY